MPTRAGRGGGTHRRRPCSRNSAPSLVKRLSSRTPSARSLFEMRTSGDDISWRPHCAAHITHAPPIATKIGYACTWGTQISAAQGTGDARRARDVRGASERRTSGFSHVCAQVRAAIARVCVTTRGRDGRARVALYRQCGRRRGAGWCAGARHSLRTWAMPAPTGGRSERLCRSPAFTHAATEPSSQRSRDMCEARSFPEACAAHTRTDRAPKRTPDREEQSNTAHCIARLSSRWRGCRRP